MFYDKSYDDAWRGYCVQFLGQCYGRIADPGHQAVVRKLFSDATHDKPCISGTALIVMAGLADQPGFDKTEISDSAYRLCTDEKTDPAVRITALQVCAKLGKREILPFARETIRKSNDVPLKMSAIAALGMLGEKSDAEILRTLASSSDLRLRTASEAALRKLGI